MCDGDANTENHIDNNNNVFDKGFNIIESVYEPYQVRKHLMFSEIRSGMDVIMPGAERSS
jgi:hypothetical protein